MKPYSTYILYLLVIFFTNACDSNNHPDIDASLINADAPQTIQDKDSAWALPPPVSSAPVTVNNPATVALNPPHGQPGHDCAVPVGSPLSKKTNTAPASPSAAPNPANPPQILPFSKSNNSVALNPPHGQPGHDCTIPVGQPL